MADALAARRPVPPAFRWVVLGAMSLICFAQYFIYDSITPLGTMLQEQLGFSNENYGLLFSAYSVANVFLLMVLIAGVLTDRLGLKLAGILYGFLCFLGAFLTALGAWGDLPRLLGPLYGWLRDGFLTGWSPELKVMLLGRLVYGVGAEAILLVNNKVLARWFGGKELAFAYGLNLTIMRLGTFLALNLQARAAGWFGLQGALWFAALIMGLGFLTFFGYLALERAARGRPGAPGGAGGAGASEERFVLREAFTFNSAFWYIALLCVTFYSAVFPFMSFAPALLERKFGYDPTTAGSFSSAIILGTMICTPILGWFVDRKGRRATLMIAGALLLVPCHLMLGLTRIWPVVPLFLIGVALSLVPAALWAAIPMLVPQRNLGTAFGVVGWVQGFGLWAFPMIAGKLADARTVKTVVDGRETIQSVDYTLMMLMFAGVAAVGLLFALLVKAADGRRRDGVSIEKPMVGQKT